MVGGAQCVGTCNFLVLRKNHKGSKPAVFGEDDTRAQAKLGVGDAFLELRPHCLVMARSL